MSDPSSSSEPSTSSARPSTIDVSTGQINPDGVTSLKCEDCGRVFWTQEELELLPRHAAKSGHIKFSIQFTFSIHFRITTGEKPPLSEEEKFELFLKKRMEEERKEREDVERVCVITLVSYPGESPKKIL